MDERFYFTYIIASKSRTLYVGVTGDLRRRVFQHKQKTHPGFTARYNCNRLVWFETFSEVSAAIQREKEIKGWTPRQKDRSDRSRKPNMGRLERAVVSAIGSARVMKKQILRSAYPTILAGSRGPKLLRSG